MNQSSERIQERVSVREIAKELLSLIESEKSLLTEEAGTYLLEVLSDFFCPKLSEEDTTIIPMPNSEAKQFETTTYLPFGKHKGVLVSSVDLSYLCWLIDNEDPYKDFKSLLVCYLKNEQISREIEEMPIFERYSQGLV